MSKKKKNKKRKNKVSLKTVVSTNAENVVYSEKDDSWKLFSMISIFIVILAGVLIDACGWDFFV